MSYILEALKKSERERARGNIPALDTVARQGVSHKSLWLGVLIGAGALVLLVGLAWFINVQFFRSTSVPPVQKGATGAASESRYSADAAADPENDGGTGAETAVRVKPPDEGESPVGGAARRVADISELDPDARRRIQGLSVNVVSYSEEPERRFVMLNQRIVREKETVGDGIVVKRITPEGALLSVDDYEIVIGPD